MPQTQGSLRPCSGVSRRNGFTLGIVYGCPATHLIGKAGLSRKSTRAGAVTLIQRLGSALNIGVHFHMLFLDGVYVECPDGSVRSRRVKVQRELS